MLPTDLLKKFKSTKKLPTPANKPANMLYFENMNFLLKNFSTKDAKIKAVKYKIKFEINGLWNDDSLSNKPQKPNKIDANNP